MAGNPRGGSAPAGHAGASMGGVPSPPAPLADAFVAAVRAEGRTPPAGLRLLAVRDDGARAAGPAVRLDGPGCLGPAREAMLSAEARTASGAWYTPPDLARRLAALALDGLPAELRDASGAPTSAVLDPSCGGGAVLLAVADHLVAGGVAPADALGCLAGIDLDPVAVAVAEAALWWWGARRGLDVVVDDALVVGDALDAEWPACAAVVGNPPFLGALRDRTAPDDVRRARRRVRAGDASVDRAYTDEAGLFLVAAARAVVPGGRVALLQPQSVVAARDAAGVRDAVARVARVESLVVVDGAFAAAAVDACVPVLVRAGVEVPEPGDGSWADALADQRGVPARPAEPPPGVVRVRDLATVRAGFRDEYYGLTGAVSEGGDGLRLVTVGAIDPLVVRDVEQRFDRRRWSDPRVDPTRLAGRSAAWVSRQGGPTVLVATQTRVLEAVADADGELVASVPALVVVPHDPADLWHLLAALAAPSASVRVARAAAGTGLSRDACRPTPALLGGLPVPGGPAGDAVAAELAALHARGAAGGTVPSRDDLVRIGAAADAALGVADPVGLAWWADRLPQRG